MKLYFSGEMDSVINQPIDADAIYGCEPLVRFDSSFLVKAIRIAKSEAMVDFCKTHTRELFDFRKVPSQ
jgi:hypothetical protein